MLPNFLIIGAAKAGTTSLYQYLRSHPQVFMPANKELAFFVAERNWSRGRAWYEKQFEGGGDAVAVGEASPDYTIHPIYDGVPSRIAQLLPQARLIYLIRHPIDRMRSHYFDRSMYVDGEGPLEKALLNCPIYLQASRYATQIERYLDYFPRDRLLVVISEQLRSDRERTLRRIYEFLGLEPQPVTPTTAREFNISENKAVRRRFFRAADRVAPYQRMTKFIPGRIKKLARPLVARTLKYTDRPIPEDLRRRLTDALRDDVKRLYRYLDGSFVDWDIDVR